MSYILDALKKSDQERQQQSGPDLQTVHRARRVDNQRSGVLWFTGGVCLVVVVIAAALVWFFSVQPRLQPAPPPAVAETASEPAAGESRPLPATSSSISPTTTSSTTPAVDTATAAAPPEVDKPPGPVVEFWELPDPVQQAIPPLTFSFHVYSDNPERRTIIINKRRVKEGDTVASGLLLREITEQGVILQWDRHRFVINVVDNW